MTTLSERMALKAHMALNYVGEGEVVEIGAFAGASSIAIVQGLIDSRQAQKHKLHVYDTFRFPKSDLEETYRMLFQGRLDGDSFRQGFDYFTRDWQDMMVVHEGDASKAKWTGPPIEFLHIDCSVSLAFHEAIAREFYPHLYAGSVIAHQDYGYERAPFIGEMMKKLERWLKKTVAIETTQYYKCFKWPTLAEIEAALP